VPEGKRGRRSLPSVRKKKPTGGTQSDKKCTKKRRGETGKDLENQVVEALCWSKGGKKFDQSIKREPGKGGKNRHKGGKV